MILDFDLLSWLIGIALLFAVLAVLWKRGYNVSYLFCFSVFWIYLLLVLKVAVYPIPLGRGVSEDTAGKLLPVMLSTVHFRPFYFGPFATPASIAVTVLQNLVLTVPFGFEINFLKHLKPKDFLWLAIAFGLGIEVIQFVLALISVFLGIWGPNHIVDINDAILNVIGVLFGYGIFRLFAAWYAPIQHKFKTNVFFAYIHDVTSHV